MLDTSELGSDATLASSSPRKLHLMEQLGSLCNVHANNKGHTFVSRNGYTSAYLRVKFLNLERDAPEVFDVNRVNAIKSHIKCNVSPLMT